MTAPLTLAVTQWTRLREMLLSDHADIDDATLFDTLDGLTDLTDQCNAVIGSALADEATADGLRDFIGALEARCERIRARAVAKRAAVRSAMEDAGVSKLALPVATLTLGPGRAAVQIYDEDALPRQFVRLKHEPMKSAIAAALKNGEDVPGARFGNAAPILTVHTR